MQTSPTLEFLKQTSDHRVPGSGWRGFWGFWGFYILAGTLTIFGTPGISRSEAGQVRPALLVLPFSFDSPSPLTFNESSPEFHRLEMITTITKEVLSEALGSTNESTETIQKELSRISDVTNCNQCATDLGKKVGADLVVSGQVDKISNLILMMLVIVDDVNTGQRVTIGTASIRGNTDQSWDRGVRWLLRYRILPGLKKQRFLDDEHLTP